MFYFVAKFSDFVEFYVKTQPMSLITFASIYRSVVCLQHDSYTIICLSFCQVRQEVLKLYRTFFRTIRRLPDEQQKKEVAEWVRADFKNYKSIPVEEEIQVCFLFHFLLIERK